MKILHTAVQSEPMIGVLRQMEIEQASADQLGLKWRSSYYLGKPVESRVVTPSPVDSKHRLRFKFSYYRWLWNEAKQHDLVLLRYSTFDPLQLLFVLFCPKPIYSVHHTLEVPELYAIKQNSSGNKLGINLRIYAETILGSISLSFVSGIIGVLPEIKDYNLGRRFIKRNIRSYTYTNGIDYAHDRETKDGSLVKQTDQVVTGRSNDIPVLLFVASVYDPWQGLEELLTSAGEYAGSFRCHVVGDLTGDQKKLVDEDDRFTAHGRQNGDYISKLSAESDVGLSILAAHKKQMVNIPALKVREYLREGLAVYAGHGDMLPSDFPYFQKGDIDMQAIVKFAQQHKTNDRKHVSELSRPYIEKRNLVKNLYGFLISASSD